MDNENANMASRYEREIPEGYEARIEGNKVIIERIVTPEEVIVEAIKGAIVNATMDKRTKQEALEWVDTMYDYLSATGNIIKRPDGSEEQQRGKYVKELKGLIRYLRSSQRLMCSAEDAKKWINDIENLCSFSDWKPSEAQLHSLAVAKNIIRKANYEGYADDLDSLYDDIKAF